MSLTPLRHDQDTLLFCPPSLADSAFACLEDGMDQVVALCLVGASALGDARVRLAQAEALDLDLFVDTRDISDLGEASLDAFPGAVCNPGQVGFLRKALGQDATLVVDAGISRHDAISGAEHGADAVMFRTRTDQVASDIYPHDDEGPQNVPDLYAWWEQMMEPPAILDLDSLDERPSWMKHVEFVAVQASPA